MASWLSFYNRVRSKKTVSLVRKELDLYDWWIRQHRLYKNNELSDEKLELLEKLFLWNPEKDKWHLTLENLVAWSNENGNLPSAGAEDRETKRLGVWCSNQRQKYRKGKLSPERVKQLEKIPGWWWDRKDKETT
jgi:hypothetical protein